MSFCRITGQAKCLPKPSYFPLLPPISPAEAKKLCRITGKVTDAHNFSPIISFAKPIKFDGVQGCKITIHKDFRYVQPLYEKVKDCEKSFDYFQEVLTKIKSKKDRTTDKEKSYFYNINEYHMSIIMDNDMEEAIRTGEFDYIHMAKDKKHINLKTNNGRILKLPVGIMPKSEIEENNNVFHGEGQSKEVLEKQLQIQEEAKKRKQNTLARKKIFEDKEKKAEEEEKAATTRPIPRRPRVKFDPKKRAEKLAKMEKLMMEQERNKALLLPKVDLTNTINVDDHIKYEKMLEDISAAQITSKSLTAVGGGDGFDWVEADKAESAGFGWDSFPHEEWIDPAEVQVTVVSMEDVVSFKDVIVSFDVVVTIETIDPATGPSEAYLKTLASLDPAILKPLDKLHVAVEKFKCKDQLVKMNDIGAIAEQINDLKAGFMVKKGDEISFVLRDEMKGDEREVISGAMIKIGEEEKFVSGLYLNDKFVPGRSFDTIKGKKFVPGQTIVNNEGVVQFVPGFYITDDNGKSVFVAGQAVNNQFVAGQIMDKGDGEPTYVPGQTILTDDGPRFIPGEIQKYLYGEEEFVPGIAMKTKEGDRFVPGQTFQTEEGDLSFTPGQIVHTVEGPSFVPGKTFVNPEGEKKFVKGDMVESEEGTLIFQKRDIIVPKFREDVIPHEDLHPVAVAGKRIAGFIVHPTNTENIQAGETLFGDMVETKDNVQFYISGKLPAELPKDGKIISGELVVEESQQRFIPGKLLNTADGEKFVPGQLVRTNHGEEFVPGQIVETSEGPKFVPGQLVMTVEGEKFVPGQVIVEKEGPKFVPGQIIQTKNGATFIPGQMMCTDEGQKFVPGQLVETAKGPRFVPGQVVETSEGPKFVPGTVIETEDGLKYVPQEASEIDEDDIEISFQGYDISPEELMLITYHPADSVPHSVLLEDEGLIDSATLKKLAVDNMVVHGRTPSPPKEKKKKKKKKGKVVLDAPEEDEIEVDEIDDGTNKIEVLKRLIKAHSTVSNVKKEREIRKILQLLGGNEDDATMAIQVNAMNFVLSALNEKGDAFKAYFHDDEELLRSIINAVGDIDEVTRNDEAKKQLRNAMQKVITRKCDKEINEIIKNISANPESIVTDTKTLVLLTEAVGVVCVTGDVEVASMLERFISEPSNPDSLREDEDVLSVLRQLLVLHRISERDPNVVEALQDLQKDPECLKNKKRIRKLIKIADLLLKKPKEEDGKFDIRHVASSKDIPTEIFEQIKADNEEADQFMKSLPDELFETIMRDNRCNERFIEYLGKDKLDDKFKSELDKFKKGMAVVIVKENVQAVIPRNYARSVCYGIMPYILIDEEGFKFFERGLTGRKLAPLTVIENTWYKDDTYYSHYVGQRVMKPGTKYCIEVLSPSATAGAQGNINYTWLLPTSGPTELTPEGVAKNKKKRIHKPMDLYTGIGTFGQYGDSSLYGHSNGLDTYSSLGDGYPKLRGASIDPYGSRLSSVDPYSRFDKPVYENGNLDHHLDTGSESYSKKEDSTSKELSLYSSAIVPYLPADDPPPIQRSDTVGRLLNKYSNFSSKKEFYHSPTSIYSKYTSDLLNPNIIPPLNEIEDDETGFTPNDMKYLPPPPPPAVEGGKRESRFLKARRERRAAINAPQVIVEESEKQSATERVDSRVGQPEGFNSKLDMPEFAPMTTYKPRKPFMSQLLTGDVAIDYGTPKYPLENPPIYEHDDRLQMQGGRYSVGRKMEPLREDRMSQMRGNRYMDDDRMSQMGGSRYMEDDRMSQMGGNRYMSDDRMSQVRGKRYMDDDRMSQMGGSRYMEDDRMSQMGGNRYMDDDRMSQVRGNRYMDDDRMSQIGSSRHMEDGRMSQVRGNRYMDDDRLSQARINRYLDDDRMSQIGGSRQHEDERYGGIRYIDEDGPESTRGNRYMSEDRMMEPGKRRYMSEDRVGGQQRKLPFENRMSQPRGNRFMADEDMGSQYTRPSYGDTDLSRRSNIGYGEDREFSSTRRLGTKPFSQNGDTLASDIGSTYTRKQPPKVTVDDDDDDEELHRPFVPYVNPYLEKDDDEPIFVRESSVRSGKSARSGSMPMTPKMAERKLASQIANKYIQEDDD